MATVSPSEPAGVAAAVLDLAWSRPATLGAGRLVCVDGPGGSGKTTLAGAIAALEPSARVVHMDDLYDGWSGLARSADQLATLLEPLAAGRPGTYRRFDWPTGDWAETVTVEPTPLLVLEGVGSGVARFAPLTTVLVWVGAPAGLRLTRGLERDGEAMREQWHAWMRDEDEHHAHDGTAGRADVVVDGTGETPPTWS